MCTPLSSRRRPKPPSHAVTALHRLRPQPPSRITAYITCSYSLHNTLSATWPYTVDRTSLFRVRDWYLLLLLVTWLVTITARSYRCESCLSRAASASIDLARAAYPAPRSTLPATRMCQRLQPCVTEAATVCDGGRHQMQLGSSAPRARVCASRVQAVCGSPARQAGRPLPLPSPESQPGSRAP